MVGISFAPVISNNVQDVFRCFRSPEENEIKPRIFEKSEENGVISQNLGRSGENGTIPQGTGVFLHCDDKKLPSFPRSSEESVATLQVFEKCMTNSQTLGNIHSKPRLFEKSSLKPPFLNGKPAFLNGHIHTHQTHEVPKSEITETPIPKPQIFETLIANIPPLENSTPLSHPLECLPTKIQNSEDPCSPKFYPREVSPIKNQNNDEPISKTRLPGELTRAASIGNVALVTKLLHLGAEVDGQDDVGFTALQRACIEGHVEVARLLISKGADVNYQDPRNGNSCLHETCWKGYSETTEILVKAKANVHSRNLGGFAPLHLACQNGHNQTCRVLLIGGTKPDIKNNYGDTPIHTASRYGHAGVTRILLSARASVKEINKNGDTALHIAAAMGRRKLTRMLLEAGIDQTIKNKQEETPSDIAKRKEFHQIFEILQNPPPVITPEQRIKKEEEQKRLEGSKGESVDSKDRKERELVGKKEGASGGKRKEKTSNSGTSSKDSRTRYKEKKKLKSESSKLDPKTRASRLSSWGVEWSPYGCHVTPPTSNKIAISKVKSGLQRMEALPTGEQYFIDLAGNVKKGPVGVGSTCFCGPLFETVQNKMEKDKIDLMDHIDAAHGQLGDRIASLECHTKGHVTALGDSVQKKISEANEHCQKRATLLQRHTNANVSHKIEQMQSWVEKTLASHYLNGSEVDRRLAVHHIDSPVGSVRRGRNSRRNELVRSKSEEAISEIGRGSLEKIEEPLYKGLRVLDYPSSMYNLSQKLEELSQKREKSSHNWKEISQQFHKIPHDWGEITQKWQTIPYNKGEISHKYDEIADDSVVYTPTHSTKSKTDGSVSTCIYNGERPVSEGDFLKNSEIPVYSKIISKNSKENPNVSRIFSKNTEGHYEDKKLKICPIVSDIQSSGHINLTKSRTRMPLPPDFTPPPEPFNRTLTPQPDNVSTNNSIYNRPLTPELDKAVGNLHVYETKPHINPYKDSLPLNYNFESKLLSNRLSKSGSIACELQSETKNCPVIDQRPFIKREICPEFLQKPSEFENCSKTTLSYNFNPKMSKSLSRLNGFHLNNSEIHTNLCTGIDSPLYCRPTRLSNPEKRFGDFYNLKNRPKDFYSSENRTRNFYTPENKHEDFFNYGNKTTEVSNPNNFFTSNPENCTKEVDLNNRDYLNVYNCELSQQEIPFQNFISQKSCPIAFSPGQKIHPHELQSQKICPMEPLSQKTCPVESLNQVTYPVEVLRQKSCPLETLANFPYFLPKVQSVKNASQIEKGTILPSRVPISGENFPTHFQGTEMGAIGGTTYLDMDRYRLQAAVRRLYNGYHNDGHLDLQQRHFLESSTEHDSHNDSGYSTRLCTASQGPSPVLSSIVAPQSKSTVVKPILEKESGRKTDVQQPTENGLSFFRKKSDLRTSGLRVKFEKPYGESSLV